MSTNKNAIIRYKVLDRCFSNPGKKYFIEDLIEECSKVLDDMNEISNGISRRQILNDIEFMKSTAGWNIDLIHHRENRRVYYRYADTNFSINNMPLNDAEAEQIKSALAVISRFSGAPQFEWVYEMIPMLETKLGLIKKEKDIINFESNIDLKGLEFLMPLFNAINNERVLLVKYKDFKSSEPYDVIFHPYYLKQYNNRWFALGLNADKKIDNWTIALDRIEELNEINIKYKNSTIEWHEYFQDMVGVTKPQVTSLEEVILKFDSDVAPYVITKPLHPSQKHKNNDSGLEVRIKVILNIELEKLILSFGEQVQVLSPKNLKAKISKRLDAARNKY